MSRSLTCGVCNEILDLLTLDERQGHYDAHFSEPGPSNLLAAPSPPPSKSRKPPHPKENVFWHTFQRTPPPKNYTPGLIPILKSVFTKLHAKGLTARAVLCADGVCHVGTEWFDLGWGCGYRNFLMACTSLIAQQKQPMYFPLLDVANGSVSSDRTGRALTGPGVRGLQAWIENAWHQGYDPEGANDKSMKWNLVGTRKFIGTSDISIAFSACGIPSSLVDFPKPPKSSGKTTARLKPANAPSEETSATALSRWIVNYFDNVPQPGMPDGLEGTSSAQSKNPLNRLKGDAVIVSERMPIILQHNGHSRTIIGYEITRSNTINLLIFDPAPGKKIDSQLRQAALAVHRSSTSPNADVGVGSPSTSSPQQSHSLVSKTSRILQKIHQLSPKSSTRKRRSSSSSSPHTPEQPSHPAKRLKGGVKPETIEFLDDSDDDDTVQLREKLVSPQDNAEDDLSAQSTPFTESAAASDRSKLKSEADGLVDALDPLSVARHFRINNKGLSRNNQYQILFFPLTDPLTEYQKEQRKVVTSTTIAHDPE